jgi:hypothetical protein
MGWSRKGLEKDINYIFNFVSLLVIKFSNYNNTEFNLIC